MRKIVLCVDNGNSHLEKTKSYLASHDCKIYTLSEKEADRKAVISEIEKKEGCIDILLLSMNERIPEDSSIGTAHDYETLLELLGKQFSFVQDIIEESLPLLRKGDTKRIGMITQKDSSVSCCRSDCNYGQHMAQAGLNMMGRLYFNLLRPEGFTFRWYCAEENAGGMSAGEYLLCGLCYDAKEPYSHSDENRFVMRDSYLREIPW